MNKRRVEQLEKEIEQHENTIEIAKVNYEINLIDEKSYQDTIDTFTTAIQECKNEIESLTNV